MVRIRLRRVGAKGRPFYRIVVADQHRARDGSIIEQVGTYDPMQQPPVIKLDAEKVQRWLKHGAQPSEGVVPVLRLAGILAPAKSG
ncbi:MAG: 30S ribosomal protein S16 [SAR202 cluster bacterium]|nr:30S ribosomal protein S16 [SAR202 cluster bacterium]